MRQEVAFNELFDIKLRNGIYKKKDFHGAGVPIINMGELFADDRLRRAPDKLLEVTDSELERFGVVRGDLLFGRRSLVFEGSGKSSVVEFDDPAVFESSLIRVRLDRSVADPDFYAAFFWSPEGRRRVLAIASQTAVSGIRGSDLAEIKVPHPPLETQRAVGSAVRKFDDLIENNRRRIEILEEMARLLYREWFVHFRFPGHEDVELIDSELGPIPEGWEAAGLGESASFVGGSATTKAAYVDEGFTAFSAAGPDGFLPEFDVDGHGVVLSAVGARCGRTFRASGKWSSIANTIKIIPDHEGFEAWLYFVTSDPSIWPKRGSAQPFVSINDARGVRVVTPSRESAAHFEDHARPMLDLQDNLKKQNDVLREARDLLLPRLVSGQLDVSDLDLDGVLA